MAWSLHRNLGFPLDLVDLMLEERSMTVDKRGLELLAAEHGKVGLVRRFQDKVKVTSGLYEC